MDGNGLWAQQLLHKLFRIAVIVMTEVEHMMRAGGAAETGRGPTEALGAASGRSPRAGKGRREQQPTRGAMPPDARADFAPKFLFIAAAVPCCLIGHLVGVL